MAYNTVSYSSRALQSNEDDTYEVPNTRDLADHPDKVVETQSEMDATYAVPDVQSSLVKATKNVEQEMPDHRNKCTAVKAVVILSFVIAVVSIILTTSFLFTVSFRVRPNQRIFKLFV